MYHKKSRPPMVLNHVAPLPVAHLTPLSYAMFHMSAPPLPRYVPPPQQKPKKIITGVASVLDILKNEASTETNQENQNTNQTEKTSSNLNCCCVGTPPASDDKRITSDPEKTLFVARMSYEVDEKDLESIFSQYGRIRKVRVIRDETNKSRGYAFIEFEHQRDFKEAYKRADGMKIRGRRILVDYERARVDSSWKPRKAGGGRGRTRAAVEPKLKQLLTPIGYGNSFKRRYGPPRKFGSYFN